MLDANIKFILEMISNIQLTYYIVELLLGLGGCFFNTVMVANHVT